MNLRTNDFKVGLITGLLVPILTYGLLSLLFMLLATLLTSLELSDPNTLSQNWRERTHVLLAICGNLIPFNLHKKARHEASMRGMIFPTILFVAIWVWWFRSHLGLGPAD